MSAHRWVTRWVAMTGAGIAVLLLSACAAATTTPNSTPSGFTGPPVPVGSGDVQPGIPAVGAGGDPSAGFNTVDLAFLQQMIPHHEQTLRMLALTATNGASPEVHQIAATEQTALPNEVEKMSTSLVSLGLAPPSSDPVNGPAADNVTDADVTRLAAKSGPDFDTYFVYLMNRQSRGSVALASGEADQGFNTPTRTLAAGIARRNTDLMLALSKLGS